MHTGLTGKPLLHMHCIVSHGKRIHTFTLREAMSGSEKTICRFLDSAGTIDPKLKYQGGTMAT